MAQKPKYVGNGIATPSSDQQVIGTIFLARTATAGNYVDVDLLNGNIQYFERTIRQSFEYVMVDNIGSGETRLSFNKPGMDLSSSIDGAKTLRAGDSLYIQDSVRHLRLYFIEDSIIELILITK